MIDADTGLVKAPFSVEEIADGLWLLHWYDDCFSPDEPLMRECLLAYEALNDEAKKQVHLYISVLDAVMKEFIARDCHHDA